ncbi:MAG: hypothetical protein ACWGQW_04175 [bacterium]
MYTYVLQRKATGEFYKGNDKGDRWYIPLMTRDLNKAVHRNTPSAARDLMDHSLKGNSKHYHVVKVAHELSIVED